MDLLQRLVQKNNELVKKATSLDNKVDDMQKLAFEGQAKDPEQRKKVGNRSFTLCD